ADRGVGQVGELGAEAVGAPAREGDDQMSGTGAIDDLGQAVDPAQDRHGVGPGVDDELAAPAGDVDEADAGQARPGALGEAVGQAADRGPGADQAQSAAAP